MNIIYKKVKKTYKINKIMSVQTLSYIKHDLKKELKETFSI